jgi:hypothetical protein
MTRLDFELDVSGLVAGRLQFENLSAGRQIEPPAAPTAATKAKRADLFMLPHS